MVENLPSAKLAVYIFLEMIALGFALEAVTAFMRGDRWWKWVGAIALGIVFMVFGVKSQQITERFSRHLNSRLIWMATFWIASLCSPYFLQRLAPVFSMNLHQRLSGPLGYGVVGLVGAFLSCACWWFVGKVLIPPTAPAPAAFVLTDPIAREAILRALANTYQAKAAYLENPLVHKLRADRQNLRRTVEDIETKVDCLIDAATVECLPRPPKAINKTELEINISTIAVAEEIYKSRFWIVRKKENSKFRVPIAIFLSVTNRHEAPIKIDLLYLESRSSDTRWVDIRMADSLNPSNQPLTMDTTPLVLESENNSCVVMKGDYLLPSLYNRLIQPGSTVIGWLVAEFPKGIQHGDLIAEIRLSVMDANKQWISSKTFAAHPSAYPAENAGPLVEGSIITPFDFFISED